MPHAALWVVQQNIYPSMFLQLAVSMPHAALWVVQRKSQTHTRCSVLCFNAARGFVGGAAKLPDLITVFLQSFNAARGFVGGAAARWALGVRTSVAVSMPHAALWVVQQT